MPDFTETYQISAPFGGTASLYDGQELEGGTPTNTDTTVKVRSNSSAGSRYWGGLVFVGTEMPSHDAVITAAKLEIYCDNTATDDADFVIWGHDVASPGLITGIAANISGRTRTTESVSWVEDGLGTGWNEKTGLEAIIQELVTSYTPGPICLILRPNTVNDKTCTFHAWDEASHVLCAKLTISWTETPTRAYRDNACGLAEIDPTTNYINVARWGKWTKAQEDHWLMRCDFSAEIPVANTITAASLWLYNVSSYYVSYPPSGLVFKITRCLQAWVSTQATYNIYATGSNWGTAGALSEGTDIESHDPDMVETYGVDVAGWWSVNLTDMVQHAHAADQILNIVLHSPLGDLGGEEESWMDITAAYTHLLITHTSPAGTTKCQVVGLI
jgi:hypothetical protein